MDNEQERDVGYTIIWKRDGDGIQVRNANTNSARFLLIAGKPLNEPVSRAGKLDR